jgi:hypothetical protein
MKSSARCYPITPGAWQSEGLKAVGEVLHHGGERQTPKFRQAAAADWWTKAKEA